MRIATATAASWIWRCRSMRDYLRWYGNTDLAPNAQYYIAWIHASQGDYENAIREYDMVLEKYPDNNKTADAMYGKGVALARDGPPHGRRARVPGSSSSASRTTDSPARHARSSPIWA